MNYELIKATAIGAATDMGGKVLGALIVLWVTLALIVGTVVLAVRIVEVTT